MNIKKNTKKKMLALTMMVLCLILVSACSSMNASSKEEKPKTDQNPQNVQTVKNEQEQSEPISPATAESTTVTKEENLLTIFNSKLEVQEKVAELVKNLDGVDFSKLTNGEQNDGINIMDYLVKHSDKITPDNYNALFFASNNQFDGVLSESYASIVGQVFMKDKEAVIITLASMENEATQKQVISSIGYNLSYVEYTKVKKELDEFKESTPLGEKEKSIVDQILKKVENPY
ncbi:hypothetical protein J2Z32_002678 [Paenibacillus turicensis]|uniref:Lipoprotein n=1 Tax=Paenibacillus turicensis TaxID=160487 RepID=A0ABS4FU90_9BACL|nr:hypothetical protein [Paenibacillus turicensis]MBP1906029.1 hypothetical protein [Paenibacillus turicensis]